jgi:hypothetical protein
LGRRQYVSATARLIGSANGWYTSALSPQSTAVLDVASYGGWYAQATVTSSGWSPRAFSETPADIRGVYHVWSRFQSQQSTGNIANVQTRPITLQRVYAWYGVLAATDDLGEYGGQSWSPLSAGSVWAVADSGQVTLPPFPQGAAQDPAQTYLTPRALWFDSTGGGSVCLLNWEMLLPIDSSLMLGSLVNPSNSPYTNFSSEWLFAYLDGSAVQTGGAAATMWNSVASALPASAQAGGGTGTTGSGPININVSADSFPTLDPTLQVGSVSVNQFAAAYVYGATVQAVVAEITYAPLYLTLR